MKHFIVVLFLVVGCPYQGWGHEHMHTSQGALPATPRKKHPPRPVKVVIDFVYADFTGKIQVYDVKENSKYDISETRNVKEKAALPVLGDPQREFKMKTGDSRTMVLVIENKTSKDMYFNATPHSIMPVESSVSQKFECLCNHSIFKVAKKSFWYRIVRLDLGDDFEGSSITLTHNIIGIKNADAKGKYNEMLYK